MRNSKQLTLATILLAVNGVCTSPLLADTGKEVDFDISPQSLSQALNTFARQADIQVFYSDDITNGLNTRNLGGKYAPEQALELLLADSGLTYQWSDENTIVINRAETTGDSGKQIMGKENSQIEEMIVTATKRGSGTGIQNTAMSVSALGEEEIERRGLLNTADFLRSVPGVSMLDHGPGAGQVVIRGIGINQYEQATVSSYLGEIPTNISSSNDRVDMKLLDLERIEVLRGPQGTLYGGGAMSGTVRNIPNSPKLDKVEGKLDVGIASPSHSRDMSGKMVGILNLPIVEDALALRVVGYRYENAGVKDLVSNPTIETLAANTGTHAEVRNDVDSSIYTGGRATLLWQPSDQLKLSITRGTQTVEVEEGVDFNIEAGGYQSYGLQEVAYSEAASFDFTHLLMEYDFSWATLTSASTWYDIGRDYQVDLSRFLSTWASKQASPVETEAFIQEVRLSTHFNGPLQFIAGAYYEELDRKGASSLSWVGSIDSLEDLGFGNNPIFSVYNSSATASQKAFFGEFEYALNEQWSATLGGRWFKYDREDGSNLNGSYFGTIARTPSYVATDENDSTYKLNISYKPNDDIFLYGTWAQGFRIGMGQSLPPSELCDVDSDGKLDFTDAELKSSVGSDSTTNFELGAKLTFLDSRLTVNTALYRINWKDIPVRVFNTSDACSANFSITVNGGEARSRGLELETQYYVVDNLKIMLAAAYTDTEFLNDNVGGKGERLPLTPEVNGNLAIEYSFDLAGNESFIRSDYTYVGGFYTDVPRNFPKSGDYWQWNLRAGVSFDNFSVEIFGNNLTDEYALMGLQSVNFGYLLPPRIIGLDIGYRF